VLRVLRPHAVRVVDSGLRLCAQSTMAERAATRRRFYYNIVEVQALQALAASIIHNVTAYIIHVVGLLISAPALLHFGAVLFGLAFGQLRLATAALALALRRASQREADYPQRTWRHYKANADFRHDFRFDRAHLPRLIRAMRLPETVTFKGYSFTADEAVSVLLLTLATNATLNKINQKFGIKRSKASTIMSWSVQVLHDMWYKPLFVTDFRRWTRDFPEWAAAVCQVQGGDDGTSYRGIVAFVDGTLNPTCRPPPWLQRAFYSGYKKKHGVHWQGTLALMGLLIDLAGPFEGRHTDKWMLNVSELTDRLKQALDWAVDNEGAPVTWPAGDIYFFGDAGYNRRLQMQVMHAKPPGRELTDAQTRVNLRLSKSRIANEWIFGRIGALWPYVACKTKLKVRVGNVGSVFIVATLLTNALTCLEGSATSKYFGLVPPTLEEYFDDAPAAASCPRARYENVDKYDQVDA